MSTESVFCLLISCSIFYYCPKSKAVNFQQLSSFALVCYIYMKNHILQVMAIAVLLRDVTYSIIAVRTRSVFLTQATQVDICAYVTLDILVTAKSVLNEVKQIFGIHRFPLFKYSLVFASCPIGKLRELGKINVST